MCILHEYGVYCILVKIMITLSMDPLCEVILTLLDPQTHIEDEV